MGRCVCVCVCVGPVEWRSIAVPWTVCSLVAVL